MKKPNKKLSIYQLTLCLLQSHIILYKHSQTINSTPSNTYLSLNPIWLPTVQNLTVAQRKKFLCTPCYTKSEGKWIIMQRHEYFWPGLQPYGRAVMTSNWHIIWPANMTPLTPILLIYEAYGSSTAPQFLFCLLSILFTHTCKHTRAFEISLKT